MILRQVARGVPRRRLLGLLGVTVLLSGCAEGADFQTGSRLGKGEGVAFGRIQLTWNGKEEKSLTSFFGEKPWSLIVQPDGSQEAREILLGGDGSFIWHLPAGGYTIAGFHGTSPGFAGYRVSGRIFAHFTVTAHVATYIGTLAIFFRGARYRAVVLDESERNTANKQAGHLPARISRHKALMILESSR